MENEKHTQIEKLFCGDRTVAALRITDYLHWASNHKLYSTELAMPPIQRGFVWKPKQIQDLWDSLLRGMPIGSVLLKASRHDELSAPLEVPDKRYIKENPKPSFHLMDGQQRTLSMLLGFPDSIEAQHKLWIDFSVAGKNGSQFQFRVTTVAQPFGYNADGGRLLLQDRRDARVKWNGPDEDKTKEKKSNQDIFKDETTRPWKAGEKQQGYIFEVKKLWQWLPSHGTTVSDWIETVKTEITKYKKDGSDIDKPTLDRIEAFGNSIYKLQHQWLALIKIPDVKVQSDIEDPSHDYLTMLFDRISSNGTRLSPDDLLFSMIKQSWPDAHNIVYNLQEQVGSLMKPTDFIMTAFRLAALQSDDSTVSGDPVLNALTFHKHLGGLLGTEAVPGDLRKMIGKDGPLVRVFKKLIEIIKYRDEDKHHHAIPSAMFPYMNESMLQVILHWMILNEEITGSFEDSRDDIVRFILFWFVCNKDATSAYKASKVAIGIISSDKGDFPGVKIFQELTEMDADRKSLFFPLIVPPSKEIGIDRFRTQEQRAEHFFGKASLYTNFTSRKGLLLWFQRKWVDLKYESKDFIPMAGQDEDNVPYDFDHLVPQSNWSSLGGINREGITESRKIFEDLYHRRALGNSIGNYRVLDSSDNRRRGDKPLENEFLKQQDQWNDYAFNPSIEVELQKWERASPVEKYLDWDDERLFAFQYAVESRVLYLYKRYFDDAKFEAWLPNEHQ